MFIVIVLFKNYNCLELFFGHGRFSMVQKKKLDGYMTSFHINFTNWPLPINFSALFSFSDVEPCQLHPQ